MTNQTRASVTALATFLDKHSALPEPFAVTAYRADGLGAYVDWRVDEDTARRIIAAIGGKWWTQTYDEDNRTICSAYEAEPGPVHVTVVVEAVIPDLAAVEVVA